MWKVCIIVFYVEMKTSVMQQHVWFDMELLDLSQLCIFSVFSKKEIFIAVIICRGDAIGCIYFHCKPSNLGSPSYVEHARDGRSKQEDNIQSKYADM